MIERGEKAIAHFSSLAYAATGEVDADTGLLFSSQVVALPAALLPNMPMQAQATAVAIAAAKYMFFGNDPGLVRVMTSNRSKHSINLIGSLVQTPAHLLPCTSDTASLLDAATEATFESIRRGRHDAEAFARLESTSAIGLAPFVNTLNITNLQAPAKQIQAIPVPVKRRKLVIKFTPDGELMIQVTIGQTKDSPPEGASIIARMADFLAVLGATAHGRVSG